VHITVTHAIYAAYAYLHILHIVHIMHTVRLLSDSKDDTVDPTVNSGYDQAPGDWDALPVQPPQQAPPCRPGRQADMSKTMLAIIGTTPDIDKAMLAMDAHIGQNPEADPIQSKRCGRKSR
jgi:hypothetical protein